MIEKYGTYFPDRESLDRYEKSINDLLQKYPRAALDRWAEGIDHHPKSIELMEKIMELDLYFFNDHFCWKKGGDGDNGEALMYVLDIIFEQEDMNSVFPKDRDKVFNEIKLLAPDDPGYEEQRKRFFIANVSLAKAVRALMEANNIEIKKD